MNAQYVKLSMIPSGVMPTLYVSQYDVGRPLGLIVTNGTELVDMDSYSVTIEATRSDGTQITAAVTTADNIGTFQTTATMRPMWRESTRRSSLLPLRPESVSLPFRSS